jgi:hypothetical protein
MAHFPGPPSDWSDEFSLIQREYSYLRIFVPHTRQNTSEGSARLPHCGQ